MTVTYSHSGIGTHAQKTKSATQCTRKMRQGNSVEPSVSDRGVNFRLHCRGHLPEPGGARTNGALAGQRCGSKTSFSTKM
jgi:hypothetical protein